MYKYLRSCRQDVVLTFSSEDDEKSVKELNALHLATEGIEPLLLSELVDNREVLPESMPSRIIRSVLGLSELMNDISDSDSERSPINFPLKPFGLENGDLYLKTLRTNLGFYIYFLKKDVFSYRLANLIQGVGEQRGKQ